MPNTEDAPHIAAFGWFNTNMNWNWWRTAREMVKHRLMHDEITKMTHHNPS